MRFDLFCRYTPILEYRVIGCHGNHAFSPSQNKFFKDKMFGKKGVPMKNMVPM